MAGPDGSWSLTTTPLVIVGSWRLQAGASATADPLADTFALDIINPGSRAPTILGAWDDIGNVTGQIENGMTTNDTTPELRGIAEANSVVMIEFGRPGEPYDTSHSVIANARGEWSFTPPAPLEQGVWVFRTKAANGSSYSNSWGINVAEIEVNTFTHNFEDADTGIISSGWKYGQLTLSALDSGSSFNISRVAGIGKVLLLTSPSTGTTELAKARIDFNEPVNFVQLDAIDWESADSYVSFHNSAGAEIGRIYSTNIANMAREELSFYTTGNDIAYMQFYLTAPKQHTGFYVDDIILKQNYIPPIELDSARSSLYDVNGAELELINGDDGVDTLVMSGQQQTMVMSEVAEQFSSVEVVDITGSGDNLLALSIGDVLEHGGRDMFVDDGKRQFMVQGNDGDTVQLDDLLPDGTDTGDWIAQERHRHRGGRGIPGIQPQRRRGGGADPAGHQNRADLTPCPAFAARPNKAHDVPVQQTVGGL
nr:Ig-like domain-containing protein [Duffyella gerundensis]